MAKDYLPVDPDFYDIIEKEKLKKKIAVVNYFGENNSLEDAKGEIEGIVSSKNEEKFISFDTGKKVRLDRVITINGRPGPAYDEYDSYALACLDCQGGMDT